MPITDAMRARHVVRQYLDKPVPDDVVAALRSRIEEDNRAQAEAQVTKVAPASSARCGGQCAHAA